MIKAQQIGAIPITGQQAPTLPTQAGTIPAQTNGNGGLDINSIMNLMIMLVVVVMMMKMMGKATEKV